MPQAEVSDVELREQVRIGLRDRLSTFDTAWICIKFGRPGDRQVVMDRRGGTRTRGGKAGYQLEVKRDMTVKDIKLDVGER